LCFLHDVSLSLEISVEGHELTCLHTDETAIHVERSAVNETSHEEANEQQNIAPSRIDLRRESAGNRALGLSLWPSFGVIATRVGHIDRDFQNFGGNAEVTFLACSSVPYVDNVV
jgi:hypothetical protein